MNGKSQLCQLLFFICIPVILEAQEVIISQQDMEDLMYRSESDNIPETILNAYDESGRPPLDLNSSSPEELESSGLFTPFQLYNLLNYREKYGELYSIHELSVLPGFHQSKVLELEAFICLEHSHIQNGKKRTKHMLLMDVGETFPSSKGYVKEAGLGNGAAYAGPPVKTCIRIRSQVWNKLSMGLTYEKDAGELFLYRNRPQFLSAYLSYKGTGAIRHIVLGNFQLNQGLGLVNGAGFIHQPGNFVVNRQSLSRIKPYASKTEALFNQGIACQLGQNKFQFLIWFSHRSIALSPRALIENPDADNWLEYQRSSGLYRSPGELEGRDLALRVHTGIQTVYRDRYLVVGIMSSVEWLYPSRKALEFLEKAPDPKLYQKSSLHANWQKKQGQIFGELSSAGYSSMACLLGTIYHFNDFIRGTMLVHHYDSGYQGSLPSSYASGSKIANEQGVAFHLHMETGKYITAELSGELFRYPSPRYQTTVPSRGHRLDLSLQDPGNKVLQWKARVVNKTWQLTPADGTARLRPLNNYRTTRLDGKVIYNYEDLFKWQSRLVISFYSQTQEEIPGYAAVQQLRLCSSRSLQVTAQFVLFSISDWENRIYLYEPGFYYSFNFPGFYGKGQKTTILLTLRPFRQLTFSTKISVIKYESRDVIGSGFDQINGNKKWEAGLQLRLNL